MIQNTQAQFRQTAEIAVGGRETLAELAKAKAQLRKIEEFVRKYELHSDGLGFMAGRVLQILEDKDA